MKSAKRRAIALRTWGDRAVDYYSAQGFCSLAHRIPSKPGRKATSNIRETPAQWVIAAQKAGITD
ncbi:hypothetical protein [Thermoleptolyngbya sp. C42_A2020_037]|uniref:hypothetical protein n=1 Tax=Thermoleptolyngbya sp. C42_A2020_037 TaxID=2747799 RepID=UPI0019ED24B3|nr:hypothetical protein [Thermoleptolyngbya sp. C42_A2020_037]MBF2086942.1 hypothetical protein [Thermoleptolyngbya sp. C42_A2020_037]